MANDVFEGGGVLRRTAKKELLELFDFVRRQVQEDAEVAGVLVFECRDGEQYVGGQIQADQPDVCELWDAASD